MLVELAENLKAQVACLLTHIGRAWPIPSYILNFRLNFKVVLVVLGEILPQWEVALVSGHQKLQSDMEVTY